MIHFAKVEERAGQRKAGIHALCSLGIRHWKWKLARQILRKSSNSTDRQRGIWFGARLDCSEIRRMKAALIDAALNLGTSLTTKRRARSSPRPEPAFISTSC